MVGDSLREALKNIFIRTEFRIQIQTYFLHYILLTNFPYQKLDQGKNRRKKGEARQGRDRLLPEWNILFKIFIMKNSINVHDAEILRKCGLLPCLIFILSFL